MPASTDRPEEARSLSRNETHDLSMIIKDRTKVLRAHAEEQAAACMADFEAKLATVYTFDSDAVWKEATLRSQAVIEEAQKKIAKRCKELGIPPTFAPSIHATWEGRGQNALAGRRNELRRVAKASIEAMLKAAITKIERQSLDLRTQVVSMGLLSADAKLFLNSLAPVEEAMRSLDFAEMEAKLERERQQRIDDRRRLGGY
jgi:hypothetical protein